MKAKLSRFFGSGKAASVKVKDYNEFIIVAAMCKAMNLKIHLVCQGGCLNLKDLARIYPTQFDVVGRSKKSIVEFINIANIG